MAIKVPPYLLIVSGNNLAGWNTLKETLQFLMVGQTWRVKWVWEKLQAWILFHTLQDATNIYSIQAGPISSSATLTLQCSSMLAKVT